MSGPTAVADISKILPDGIEDYVILELFDKVLLDGPGPIPAAQYLVAVFPRKVLNAKTPLKDALTQSYDKATRALYFNKVFRVSVHPAGKNEFGLQLHHMGELAISIETSGLIRIAQEEDWTYLAFKRALGKIVDPKDQLIRVPGLPN